MHRLADIKPTGKERERELAIAARIIEAVKRVSGREAMLVGSEAKDTDLKGDKDLDIFILFPKDVPRKELEREGLLTGRRVCQAFSARPRVHYAEHPYTKARINGFSVDIVPCYKLNPGDRIISAVDRSPLHTWYVIKHLKDTDEVRLLKHFAKRAGVYGSEIATHGFSGYLCELLIIHYGSFEEVVKKACRWRHGTFIDVEGHGDAKEFSEPLAVVDPVDGHRNVAAAVSEEKLAQFILMARHYARTKELPRRAAIMRNRGKLFVMEWDIKEEVDEIIWSQVERFRNKVVKQLNEHEFHVMDAHHWTDAEKKAQVLVELEVWSMPYVNDHAGPSIYNDEHCEKFAKKYGRVWVRGQKLMTERPRQYRTAKQLLSELFKDVPTHLKRRKHRLKEDDAAKRTHAYEEYSKKLWDVA
ncbi:MAG: CCA tRNA nucleotidyltransferase [Candidatus Diapherotrites archaeon]|nr:CCA tRNA nucleotidyltransferase [Candidatus Diapherotrites archaeon]